jgi:7,8-dihydropterin-6-yl-methyl-4-(beta-D-ribofuranosyl)aminobenzene 5'-phosphate synthase
MEHITPAAVDSVTITTLIDNSVDLLAADAGPAREAMFNGPGTESSIMADGRAFEGLIGEHGYSALVEVSVGQDSTTVMYDAGLSPYGLRENMRRLEVDPRDIEAMVMSHGHFDHTTGLEGIVKDLGAAAVPIVLHPDFWNQRRLRIDGTELIELPTVSRSAVEGSGIRITEERNPSFLFDAGLLVTGEIDRTTDFERGLPGQEAYLDGRWQADEATLDDQALVINVAGKGLVIMSGCGHAGIVNIVRYVRRLTGIDQVYAVIGGFHLSGKAFEPIIGRTVEALAELEPDVVVPAHCTGWRAHHALAAKLPDAYRPNVVGAKFEL